MRILSSEEANIGEQYAIRALVTQSPLSSEELRYCQQAAESGRFTPWSVLYLYPDDAHENRGYKDEYLRRPEILLMTLEKCSLLTPDNPWIPVLFEERQVHENLLSGGYYDAFNTLWKVGYKKNRRSPRFTVPIPAYRHIHEDVLEQMIQADKTLLNALVQEYCFPDLLWKDSYYAYRAGCDALVSAICFNSDDADVKREKLGIVAALTGRIEPQALYFLDYRQQLTGEIDRAVHNKRQMEHTEAWALYKKLAVAYDYEHMNGVIAQLEVTIALGDKINLNDNIFETKMSSLVEGPILL